MAETRERERGSARWWRTVEMAGRWWLQAEVVAGLPLVWFGQREERGEESKRERERCVGMIDERENEWRGVYIIPSPR